MRSAQAKSVLSPKAASCTASRGYVVQCADPRKHERGVRQLIERRYAWRGLPASHSLDASADAITLVASSGDVVFGTATLGIDGRDGLQADHLYAWELNRLRGPGVRLGEVTRLAVDSAHDTLEVLGALFHLGYIQGRQLRGITDLVIEVHPRHVGFYRRMLGFVQLGEEKPCPRVAGAPAVLMHLNLEHADRRIAAREATGGRHERSLYRFLALHQETDIPAGVCR